MDHQSEVRWKEYELQVGLYKHYLDLTMKFLAFYHVAVGAFLAFYLTRSDLTLFRYALWLPIGSSVLFAGVLLYAAKLNAVSRSHVIALAQSFGFAVWPEIRVLSVVLSTTAVVLFLWAIGLFILFLCSEGLVRGLNV